MVYCLSVFIAHNNPPLYRDVIIEHHDTYDAGVKSLNAIKQQYMDENNLKISLDEFDYRVKSGLCPFAAYLKHKDCVSKGWYVQK